VPDVDPRQWEEAARWLVFVDEDLRVAEILVAVSPPALRTAAFHCQQAAEKMAKALLIAFSAEVPRIHDVSELAALVADVEPAFGKAVAELGDLTGWYLAVRYADSAEAAAVSDSDIRSMLGNLRGLRAHIASLAPGE